MRRLAAIVVLVLALVGCQIGVDMANADRMGRCGLPALATDQALMQEAGLRAGQLSRDGYLHHTWNLWSGIPAHYAYAGENVGQMVGFPDVTSAMLAAQAAFMSSGTHAANICAPQFRAMGYSIHGGHLGEFWVVQVFGG